MQAIPTPANCCTPCTDTATVNVPGPVGPSGTNGTNGTNGENAYSYVNTQFSQPAVNANVNVNVTSSNWFAIGATIFINNAGYYLVVSVPDSTHVMLKNFGYTANAPVATLIPAGSIIITSGEKGAAGAAGTGSGDMLSASNLAQGSTGVASTAAALVNLGITTIGKSLFTLANPSALGYLRSDIANTITPRTYAGVRTDLGLVIGTNVQAWDPEGALDSLANGVIPNTDKLPYFNGPASATVTTITSAARNLMDDTSPAMQRLTLGVLTEYGLIFQQLALNLNVGATDTAVAINTNVSRYRIDKIVVENASISLTAATLGVFTAAGGGGTSVVANQALNALTASTKFLDLTLAGGVTSDILTAATLYLRVGTPQGAAATANVHVFGWKLN